MKSLILLCALAAIVSAQSGKKALVGGTLIDGFGGPPIRNSVILIDGDKIQAVGQVGSLPVPPDAGGDFHGGHERPARPRWDMHVHTMLSGHSDYAHG